MAFDYDVVIIGSGFGGSVAALRAVETLRPPNRMASRLLAWASESEGGFDSFKPLIHLPQLFRCLRVCNGRLLV